MHKTAINFALRHHISLGRFADGHYYIRNYPVYAGTSMYPTARSAIIMMRRYLRRIK